jgi:signal transduction histidine kinase
MTTQFSDFLAAHAVRIAELVGPDLHGPFAADAEGGAGEPRQLINAVLVALTAGDLRPLITLYGLERAGDLRDRLTSALLDVQALRPAVLAEADEEGLDAEQRTGLVTAAGEEVGTLVRTLAVECVGALERQLESATSSSSSKGTSLSITMHELRRPLTILNSYGQLLSTGMLGSLPESAMVAIEGITASTEMMVRMVNSLAELSRLEDPEDRMTVEVIPAKDIVGAALEHVAMEAKLRGTTITADVAEGLLIRGDRRRLTLALTNLLGNAIKHGPPESTVEVTVRGDEHACAHFTVRDHGAGFPQEDADHLFEKYFRSVAERQRKVPGSGLGLYIVRTVVERHGGRCAARSVPGDGAEFEMIIPMQREEP